MTVVALSLFGAIAIVVACVALLALASGPVIRNVSGRSAESVDPLGDRIDRPESSALATRATCSEPDGRIRVGGRGR